MSVASAVSAVKRAVVPDPIAGLALRTSDCSADIASTEAEKSAASTALTAAERAGDVRAGDDAARRVEVATARLVRLGVRRQALALATKEADAAKAAAEKTARVDALKAEAERARLAADMAEQKSVALCLKLSEALSVYASEGLAERAAAMSLERETGAPVGFTRRYLSLVTAEALRRSGTLSSFDISLPVLR